MLTWTTAGESHGPALIASMEGVPSGVSITTEMLGEALAERRLGYGRGTRQKFEQDRVEILSGVRHGRSTGAPLTIVIHNSEWPKWETVMSADPVPDESLQVDAGRGDHREMARNRILTRPRPGHADLAGSISYRLADSRDVLERASARETAARVALGAIAKEILRSVAGVNVLAHVLSIGQETSDAAPLPDVSNQEKLRNSPVRTLDEEAAKRFIAAVDAAKKSGDTVGGSVEIVAWNVPLGLGSHTSSDQKLDARLAGALMSIQSAKGVEIGEGFNAARTLGSAAQDEIVLSGEAKIARRSNRAGGIEGGTSNGQPIISRVAFKPISTVPRALRTVDLQTGEETTAFHQRSDTSQVVPAAVIAEAVVALVLAEALLERFGGRSLAEVRSQFELHQAYVESRLTVKVDSEAGADQ